MVGEARLASPRGRALPGDVGLARRQRARGGCPASDLALSHGAGVAKATGDPREACAGWAEPVPCRSREGDLPNW